MEVAVYTRNSSIFERREVNNLTKTGTVSAKVLHPGEEYNLRIKLKDPPSVQDEYYILLLEDPYGEADEHCQIVNYINHKEHDVPFLTLDDGGERLHTAKCPGYGISLKGKLKELTFRINTTVTDCTLCDVLWLRIYLDKWDKAFDHYLLQDTEEFMQDIPLVMMR